MRLFILCLHFLIMSCAGVERLEWILTDSPAPVKLMHLSDLHLRNRDARYMEAAAIAREWKPDILVLTGDQYSNEHGRELLVWFLDLFPEVAHKAAIMGNHDVVWGHSLEADRILYETRGWSYLVNQTVEWDIRGRKVRVWGSDDFLLGRWSFEEVDPDGSHVFLIHEPELFDVILDGNPGLSGKLFLAGHTHGGQITFFGSPVILPPGSGRFVAGRYERDGNTLFVSKGLGNTGIELRFYADYDVNLIEF